MTTKQLIKFIEKLKSDEEYERQYYLEEFGEATDDDSIVASIHAFSEGKVKSLTTVLEYIKENNNDNS